jgi:DNA-binding LacI/PurR family transcriptional regulator
MGKKIRNKDLAERLGVSGTLVSLVLNNKADLHGIRKDTQERVLTLARQMGFFDKPREKNEILPVEEKPGIIGMIVPNLQDPFVYEITPYLQKAFSSIGVGFSIMTKDRDDQRYNRMVSAFKKFFSGLILVGDAADDFTVRMLRSIDFPIVLLEQPVNKLRINSVSTDISAGSVQIANHIEKLGYKNVMIISEERPTSYDIQIMDELKKAITQKPGINKPLQIEIQKPAAGEEINFAEIEKYLRPPYHTEILVILHSTLVYPIVTILQRKKIRIPHDIALISMEDGYGFPLFGSQVTTMVKPVAGMALKVANMIWTDIKNSGRSKFKRQVKMIPEIVVRNSCGTL